MSNVQLSTQSTPTGLKALLSQENIKKQFALALPRHLSPDRFCRVAITAISRNPKLAECTPESFMRCLLDLSAFGLEPDGRRAHLIPYKDQCTLVIDWKGLAELAMRSGVIAKLHMDVVCENDVFEYDMGEVKAHKVNLREPRGAMYAVYAIARTKTGEVFCDAMGKDEVDAIMKRSQGYKSAIQYNKSHPWLSDYNEMAKKTVFRRLSKKLPLSAEFRDAQERDDEDYTVRDVTPPQASESKLFAQTAKAEPAALVLDDSAPSQRETFLAKIQALGAPWADVQRTLLDNGILEQKYDRPELVEEHEVESILATFPQLEKMMKGGAK